MGRILGVGAGLMLVVAVGSAVTWGLPTYNELVQRQEVAAKEWAQVETVLQRRYDLIPSLLELTKDFTNVETGVIADVRAAYSGFRDAHSMDARVDAAQRADNALHRVPVLIGQMYPQLRASERYQDLMRSLEATENLVAERRLRFNDAVGAYNGLARTGAGQVVCASTGLKLLTYYNPPSPTQESVTVESGSTGATKMAAVAKGTPVVPAVGYTLGGTLRAGKEWTAMLLTADGRSHNVKRGDILPNGAKVVEVAAGRAVLEEQSKNAAGQSVTTRVEVTQE